MVNFSYASWGINLSFTRYLVPHIYNYEQSVEMERYSDKPQFVCITFKASHLTF